MALGPRGGGMQVRNDFLLQELSLLLLLIINTERKKEFPPSRVQFVVVVDYEH